MKSTLSRTSLRALLASSVLFLLAACQSVTTTPGPLADARTALRAAEADPVVASAAPLELQQAREALGRAEREWADDQDVDEMRTLTHIARQRVAIARAVAERQVAEARVQQAQAERERVRADVRTREAQLERQRAVTAQDQLRRQQQQATLAMEQAADRNRRLENELKQLQAKQTERGLVITLGDVLFDTGRAELRGGALRSIQRIAAVLRDHPERRVLIEGYTDSQGSASFNLDLAERRAEAVRRALTAQGVSHNQIEIRAFGEANPVASNDTAAGRQLNRRVEMIFSDAAGTFAAR